MFSKGIFRSHNQILKKSCITPVNDSNNVYGDWGFCALTYHKNLDSSKLTSLAAGILSWSKNIKLCVTCFNTYFRETSWYCSEFLAIPSSTHTTYGLLRSYLPFVIAACLPGTFGEDCEYTCDNCLHGAQCAQHSRACICTAGWMGDICETPCEEVCIHPASR